MRRWISLLLLTPTLLASQTLRGSSSSVDLMYDRALANDLDFLRTPMTLAEAVKAGNLKMLNVTMDLDLDDVGYPFLLPAAHAFTNALAARYRAACGERLVVTSAARPRNKQPRNASPKSVHPTGMAVDFHRPTGTCLTWLRDELLSLEKSRLIEATEERHPPHFHVAVLKPTASPTVIASAVTAPPNPATRAPAAPAVSTKQTTPRTESVAAGDVVPKSYTVKKGDALSTIAKRFGTTTKRLQQLNGIRGTKIKVGQKLVIGG